MSAETILQGGRKAILSHALLLLFVFASFAVVAMSIYSSRAVEYFVSANESNICGRIKESALRLAGMVRADELDAYRGPADMGSPGYISLKQKLASFADEAEVKYAYFLRVAGDEMQFIIDNDFDEATRVGLDTPPVKLADVPGLPSAVVGRKAAVTPLGSYMANWDYLCSAYAPVFDADGEIVAYCGVDIDDKEILATDKVRRRAILLELATIVLAVACGLYGLFVLHSQNNVLAHTATKLLSMSLTDPLTGIYNRRHLDGQLKRVINSLGRSNNELSLLLIDIDYFKLYNDTYGHDAGDTCLKRIAECLSQCHERGDDFSARYGGEEFVVVLPHTDESGARLIATRLLESVMECNIPHKASKVADRVTVSIGGTTGTVDRSRLVRDYIKCADEALYESKKSGRNRYTHKALKAALPPEPLAAPRQSGDPPAPPSRSPIQEPQASGNLG